MEAHVVNMKNIICNFDAYRLPQSLGLDQIHLSSIHFCEIDQERFREKLEEEKYELLIGNSDTISHFRRLTRIDITAYRKFVREEESHQAILIEPPMNPVGFEIFEGFRFWFVRYLSFEDETS